MTHAGRPRTGTYHHISSFHVHTHTHNCEALLRYDLRYKTADNLKYMSFNNHTYMLNRHTALVVSLYIHCIWLCKLPGVVKEKHSSFVSFAEYITFITKIRRAGVSLFQANCDKPLNQKCHTDTAFIKHYPTKERRQIKDCTATWKVYVHSRMFTTLELSINSVSFYTGLYQSRPLTI